MLFLLLGGPFEHNLAIPVFCMSPSVTGPLPAGCPVFLPLPNPSTLYSAGPFYKIIFIWFLLATA